MLFLSLFLWTRNSSAKTKVDKIIADLKAQSIPIDNASLLKRYEAETIVDKAPEWKACLDTLNSKVFLAEADKLPLVGNGTEVPLEGEWADENDARAFLKKWQPQYEELHSLSISPKPYRVLDQFTSFSTLLPYTQHSRQAARLAGLHGLVALRDNNGPELLKAVEVQRGIAGQSTAEGFLVSELVRVAIEGMSISLIKQGIEKDLFSSDDLRKLLPSLLRSAKVDTRWQKSMISERAMFLAARQDPSQFNGPAKGSTILGSSQDDLVWLQHLQQSAEANSEDLDRFLQDIANVEKSFAKETGGSILNRLEKRRSATNFPALKAAADAPRSRCHAPSASHSSMRGSAL